MRVLKWGKLERGEGDGNTQERKIHVSRKMKELNVKGSQGNTARGSRE